jgi:hypothetical protein
MAKSKTNIITHGYHGKVGDQFVLRVRGSNSMICAKPDRSSVELTQNQKDQTRRFSGAVNYAKSALADPVKRAYYEARATKEISAYNRAVADFLTKPWIDQIDAIDYTGHPGDKIRIIASDNIKVDSVSVSITDNAGAVLETSTCVFDGENMNWVYTASTTQAVIAGLKVVAIVRDMPGHVVERTLTL